MRPLLKTYNVIYISIIEWLLYSNTYINKQITTSQKQKVIFQYVNINIIHIENRFYVTIFSHHFSYKIVFQRFLPSRTRLSKSYHISVQLTIFSVFVCNLLYYTLNINILLYSYFIFSCNYTTTLRITHHVTYNSNIAACM